MGSISHVCSKLEHPATLYPEFANDKIISLHTCVLYTAVKLESGAIFWWGVLPFNQQNVSWTNTSTRKGALRPRAKPAKRVKSPAKLRPPPTSSQLPPMLDQADHPMKSLLAVKFVCEKHQFTMPVPLDTPFREEFPKLANYWNLLGVSRK